MFNSLRSRLWFTYALLILMVLCGVSTSIFFSLRQSPLLYRNTIARLNLAEGLLLSRLKELELYEFNEMTMVIKRGITEYQVRVGIINEKGRYVYDSNAGSEDQLPSLTNSQVVSGFEEHQIEIYRDNNSKEWFFTVSRINPEYFLVLVIPRPVLPLRSILQDEFIIPIFQAGLIALTASLIVSLIMARWVVKPLQKMARSASCLANGTYQSIPPEGPSEVQELAITLNDMSDKVLRSVESQREFVANVSHELKTPLTSMQGFAQAITEGTLNTKQDIRKAGRVILDETNRLNRLVIDLLTLARLEGGTADLQKTKTDLEPILNNIVEKFSLQARQQKINLTGKFEEGLVVKGDGDRLAQVFSNLVDNSLKFTPSDGKIKISAIKKNDSVLVKVEDNGMGIARENQKRIFDRFFQVDKSRKGGEGRGIGLGLAISKQIVLAHYGQIWVESDGKSGSTFMVKLPKL